MSRKKPTAKPTAHPQVQPIPQPIPALPVQGPAELLLRFAPTTGLGPRQLLITIPGGRESTIPADADSFHAIMAILDRLARSPTQQQQFAAARAQQTSLFPINSVVRFIPPQQSTWRQCDWWPRGADGQTLLECPMTVRALHTNGSVLCTVPNEKNYLVPSHWLAHSNSVFHPSRPSRPKGGAATLRSLGIALCLADLGL
jgi:hypothetical protein